MTTWPTKTVLLALHDQHLAEHRGRPGLRDLESLQRVVDDRPQLFEARRKAGLADLAAAYASSIVREQPFLDANLRTAVLACELFLAMNEHNIVATAADRVRIWSQLGAGNLTERDLADWLRSHAVEVDTGTCRAI